MPVAHQITLAARLRPIFLTTLTALLMGVYTPALAHSGESHNDSASASVPVVRWVASNAPYRASQQIEGRFAVRWRASEKPAGDSQFLLEFTDGTTAIIRPGTTPDINLWEFNGQRVAVSGEWTREVEQVFDGGGEAPVFVATRIQSLEPLVLNTDFNDHASADSAAITFAETAPEFVNPPVGMATAPEDRIVLGEWGPVIAWPHVPVSAANLPDGRILTYASNQRTSFPAGPEFTYAATWDPASGTMIENNHQSHDMFCGHLVMLEDGSVFINGGRNHVTTTTLFDFNDDSWNVIDPMNRGRWYPTSVALANGEVLTAIGSSGGQYPDLWTPGFGWQLLTGIDFTVPILNYSGHYERNWWPLINVTPTGEIFHSGPTPQMHVIDPTGSGSITPVGAPFTDWYPKHGTTVMYEEGKLLVAGGAISGSNTASSNLAMTIDINGAAPLITSVAPMANARKYQNGVMLPNGEVLVIGGNTSGIKFNDSGTIYAGEIWNPQTGTWRETAEMASPRNYHSIALLMTDGRVLSGGGGLCNCAADHQDAQVYSPPYLFNPDGSLANRPEITDAPTVIGFGSSVTVEATPGIVEFSMIKMSATTHAVNTDLRFLDVSFSETTPGTYRLTSHDNPNVLTPGYWMLFALDGQGVPSVAAVMQVVTTESPQITSPGDQSGVDGESVSLTIQAEDPNGDPMAFDAIGLPPGLAIDSVTGLISGTLSGSGAYAVTVTVSDGTNTANASFTWTVGALIDEDFESGTGGHTYLDDAFRATSSPAYASGVRLTNGGFSGAGLQVLLGGINNDDIFGMSGGWWREFVLSQARGVTISFHYQLTHDAPHESDEFAQALMSLNGQLYGEGSNDYLAQLTGDGNGGSDQTTGWRLFTLNIAQLPAGTHTLTIGGYSNQKTYNDESTEVLVDDVKVVALPPPNQDPVVIDPGDQNHTVGMSVGLSITASDTEGDPLTFTASGLPPTLAINATSGMISGTVTTAGTYNVTVTADDGIGGSGSAFFVWTIDPPPPIVIDPIVSPPAASRSSVSYTASASGGTNHQYSWLFGDGTPQTPPSAFPEISHSFVDPGRYVVTLTVSGDGTSPSQMQFVQAVHGPLIAGQATHSTSILFVDGIHGEQIWNVNPDNDSVTVYDVASDTVLAEIPVGDSPRTLAIATDGRIWVVNKRSATVSVIDPTRLVVDQTLVLDYASRPAGIVFDPAGGDAFVSLEASGEVVQLSGASGAETGRVDVGANPRHLSIGGDGANLLISRFISPPLPDEETGSPQTEIGQTRYGGEVVVVDVPSLSVDDTIVLRHSEEQDSEHGARGIPNYLGPAVISPDGASAWVPSKQDNIKRGVFRDGLPLTHDSTVRAITSRIDLSSTSEDYPARVDHDDSSVPSTALFGIYGSYLFVALEGSRDVAVIEPYGNEELLKFAVGRAPQGLALSGDGLTLYVHNFMDRSVSAYDVSSVVNEGGLSVASLGAYSTVSSEALSAEVLLGKQLFYDARDPKLSLQQYISCASCHNDGAQDGRVWDLTGFGEGLRNTINLRGQAGMAHGRLHWSANFDEVQDFEGQIRALSGGSGLMDDAEFFAATRSQPLGDPKTGISPDLDALAGYVASLDTFIRSPWRNADDSLSVAAEAGRTVFTGAGCLQCHGGDAFSDSSTGALHDIGTVKPSSGNRLDGVLPGIDTPTLRGLWATAPYLHDGSAAGVADAVLAHPGVSLATSDLGNLVAYLRSVDDVEPGINTPPNVIDPGTQSGTAGQAVVLAITASDPNGDALSFGATGLPTGLGIDGASGVIAGTLTAGGSFTVNVNVNDGVDASGVSFDWTVAEAPAGPSLETVAVTGVSSAGWSAVNLARDYQSMVAVCSVWQRNNTLPQVVRMRSAESGNSFQIRMQNPSNAALAGETVYCVVTEEGAWTLPDGRELEAQKYSSTVTGGKNGGWIAETRSYLHGYASPVVLGQVMTYNDPDWSTFWNHGSSRSKPPSASALRTGKQVAEDSDSTRANETVGYIVIEAGSGNAGGNAYVAALGGDSVKGYDNNSNGYEYSFSQSFSGSPSVAIVTQAAMDGNNGGWGVLVGATPLTSTQIRLVNDEDQIRDSERNHTTEQMGYLVFRQEGVIDLSP